MQRFAVNQSRLACRTPVQRCGRSSTAKSRADPARKCRNLPIDVWSWPMTLATGRLGYRAAPVLAGIPSGQVITPPHLPNIAMPRLKALAVWHPSGIVRIGVRRWAKKN
ncbi:MAG: hypothetical protein JJ908_03370 [Rhizobiales bacterium]|nr:hypothetical protein [Hyphomicrobiales bacterium]MBO6698357.1 hypothetical protein [Hyphomicrobiales bacterium]MBO6735389.1 hypothetical protein [Hyphomicrobiales bacterium]MBO6910803.1 hypothetical protein [Hyphomicrobiales bacterium]MBO6956477.1 hypothetical protein [Hyphomicrobiales bacterium]